MPVLTCYVRIGWADDAMLATAASFGLKLNDPRVLLAAHRILLDSEAVNNADLVSASPHKPPYFAVSLEGRSTMSDPVARARMAFDGYFDATVVLSNHATNDLQAVELRLKMEVIG